MQKESRENNRKCFSNASCLQPRKKIVGEVLADYVEKFAVWARDLISRLSACLIITKIEEFLKFC